MEYARHVANTCERCQTKMQTVADMLLLTCDARPVLTDGVSDIGNSYTKCRDSVLSRSKSVSILSKDLMSQVFTVSAKWPNVCESLEEISELCVNLMECCSHTAYIVALSYPKCKPASPGLVDKYLITKCGMEIKLICTRLKRSRIDELTPQSLMDIMTSISRQISLLTEICRSAGDRTKNTWNQEQFRFCIKSITSSANCLISSIKCFKSKPSDPHLMRLLAFSEPLMASSSALITFATENEFIGSSALLVVDAIEAQRNILGASMSIASSCIQLCKSIRELAYDVMNTRPREKAMACIEAIDRAVHHWDKILLHPDESTSNGNSTQETLSQSSSLR